MNGLKPTVISVVRSAACTPLGRFWWIKMDHWVGFWWTQNTCIFNFGYPPGPAGKRWNPYPTRFYHGSGTGETRGLNSIPEPESDRSDILGYPNPRVKLPSLVVHLYPQVVLPICHSWSDPIHLYQGSEAGCHYEAFTKFH
jgi:hypothetical protein